MPCGALVPFRCAEDRHDIQRLCHENPTTVVCPEACAWILKCGHKCPGKCGEVCPTDPRACAHTTAFECWSCKAEVQRHTCWEPELDAIISRCPGWHRGSCRRGHHFMVACGQMPHWQTLDLRDRLSPPAHETTKVVEEATAGFLANFPCQEMVEVTCANCMLQMKHKACSTVTGKELCAQVCGKPLPCEFHHLCEAPCHASVSSATGLHDCATQLRPSQEDSSLLWCTRCELEAGFRATCARSFGKQREALDDPSFRRECLVKAEGALHALGASRSSSGREPCHTTLLLGQLEYSQTWVSDRFTSGATLQEVARELSAGTCHIQDFPKLDVVVYTPEGGVPFVNPLSGTTGFFVSLDNRRLFTFRLSLPMDTQVPVRLWRSPGHFKAGTDGEYDAWRKKYDHRLERGRDPVEIKIRPALWEGDKKLARIVLRPRKRLAAEPYGRSAPSATRHM